MTILEFIEEQVYEYQEKYNEWPKKIKITKAEALELLKERNRDIKNPMYKDWLNGKDDGTTVTTREGIVIKLTVKD